MIQASENESRRTKRLILVVEDSQVNRAMIRAALGGEYEIVEAENGLVGLQELERLYRELALVLLDVYMPVCDGFEFLKRKAEDDRFATVPVIVATASGSIDDEIACLELGANDFVVKPYNFKIMKNRMGNMIKLRESASLVNLLTWDKTTGLHSKEYFYHAVEDAFSESPNAEYDLVCSDIENYQLLGERYGEANCNILLRELAQRLEAILPGVVCGGRIGSEVFAFLTEHPETGWQDMLHGVTDGLSFSNVSVKFGIVEHIDRTLAVPKTCNRARSALETIRGHHGVDVALFDDELHQRQQLEQTIRESMEAALDEAQFSVHFQPQHDLHTDTVCGAEALVRWSHPEVGFISPNFFIPIFEKSGFITKLDTFVWEEACKEIKRCRDLGLPEIPISVNVSRIDFDMGNLPETIATLADRHGVDRALLHVELTETAYSDNPEAVAETLHALKDQGFPIELDDFGAGYSSLASLNTLPLDVMKLDMSMIRQATALNDFRIMESTAKLAQVLGLKTVVEGVETAAEAARVKELGYDMVQGYYYSKPLNREDFEAYLAQR